MTPQRIQRKRTKGWRAPEGAVYVGRGTVWVRAALASHPKCDKYDDDDAITCGWKSAVRSIQWALDEEDGE